MNLTNYVYRKNRKNSIFLLAFILLVGFLVRLYAFEYTYVINKDGVFYINQARAIFEGNWQLARQCGYDFISLYHLMIPLFYSALKDWIVSAKAVSLFFGTITVIPVYLTFRMLFTNYVAFLTALIFALSPFFVKNSVELIRDPIFWFFGFMGMFFFIMAVKKDKDYCLILCSMFFLVGALARIESLVYFVGTTLYLMISKEKRAKRLFMFTLPPIVVSIGIFLLLLTYKEINLWESYIWPRVNFLLSNLVKKLFGEPIMLKSLYAFGEMLTNLIKLTYPPFFPFLIAGFLTFKKEWKENPHLSYFMILFFISTFALYIFYLKQSFLSTRYVALMMLPAYGFISIGINGFIVFLSQRGFVQKNVVGLFCIFILLFTLPADLKHRRMDKLVYKEVGKYIAQIERNQSVKVMAPDSRVMFYANLEASSIECTNLLPNYDYVKKIDYPKLVKLLKEGKIKYFLWQDKAWRDAGYDFLSTAKKEHFKEIIRWEDTSQGKLILFEIK